MKNLKTLFFLMALFLLVSNSSKILASEIYPVFNEGILMHTTIEENITSQEGYYYLLDTITVKGINASNNFLIDEKSFSGELRYNDLTFHLNGDRDSHEELVYSGLINNNDLIKFEAFLDKPNDNDANYKILLNINGLEDKPLTFLFDGNKSQTTVESNQMTLKPSERTSKIYNSLSSSPTTLIQKYDSKYISTAIFGDRKIRRGSQSYYTVRSTTNTTDVIQDLRNLKYSVWGVKVNTWEVKAITPSALQPKAYKPLSSGKTTHNATVYLGSTIGFVTIPIKIDETTVVETTNNLRVKYYWPNYSSAHEGDNSSYLSRPANQPLQMEYFIMATSGVSTGFYIDNYTQSSITYFGKVYTASNGYAKYVFPSYSIQQNWIIEVYN